MIRPDILSPKVGGIDIGAAVSLVLLNARHPKSSNEAESNTGPL